MAEFPYMINGPLDPTRGMITLDKDGGATPPKNIITNPAAALGIYLKYRFEHLKRIALYAHIEGIIAGNPPYDQDELDRHGLGHVANFNGLDANSIYVRNAKALWSLIYSNEYLAKFSVINTQDPTAAKHAETMSRHWTHVIRKWPSFNTNMGFMVGQLTKFGLSPVIWPDERDFKWRPIELSRFYVADQTQSDVELLTSVCVESNFTGQYLMEIYEKFKGKPKESTPWDTDAIAQLLVAFSNSLAKPDETWDMATIQRRLQNGDTDISVLFTDSIRLVSMYQQEYDGKVSHYMFHRFWCHDKFIFFADRQYERIQDALVIFTASPDEFTLHSNRGVGHKIMSQAQAIMMLDCSAFDAARWASTPLLKSPASGPMSSDPIRFTQGSPTNIGMAEIQQNNIGGNLQPIVQTSQYFLQKMNYNIANSGDDPGVPDKSQGSLSDMQVKFTSYREFGLTRPNIDHLYSQLDILFRNMVSIMLKAKKSDPCYYYVKEWKDRCLADGVPEVLFDSDYLNEWGMPRNLEVKAARAAGDGSTLGISMGLQQIAPFFGSMGPREQQAAKRLAVTSAFGADYIPVFAPDSTLADEQSGGASIAALENNDMTAGESPIFSPDNDQRAHITVHLALANDIVRQIQQQQMDPVGADKVFNVLVPHIGQHMQFYSQNIFGQQFIEQMKKPWKELQDYAKLNRANAARMIQAEIKKRQEEQQATEATMNEEQRKNVAAAGDENRANIKVESQVQRADKANETRAQVMHRKVDLDAANQRRKIELEAANKDKALAAKSESELRSDLDKLNGGTLAPYDIEGVTKTP